MGGVATFYSGVNIVRDALLPPCYMKTASLNPTFRYGTMQLATALAHCVFGYLTSGLNFVRIVCCLLFECVSVFVMFGGD